MGGLWLAGLVAWALLGLIPGLVCIILGAGAGAGELIKEHQLEKAEASWRKSYPPYGY